MSATIQIVEESQQTKEEIKQGQVKVDLVTKIANRVEAIAALENRKHDSFKFNLSLAFADLKSLKKMARKLNIK